MKVSQRIKLMLKSLLSLQMGEVQTDKAILLFDGEELVEGMEVFIMGEEGEPQAAEDGDYVTDDGKTIKVVEGKVAEIVDPDAEVADEPVQEDIDEQSIQAEVNEEVEPVEEPEKETEEAPEEPDKLAELDERMANIAEGINQMLNTISALEDRIVALEGKLAKVEEPAAEPIDETNPVDEKEDKKSIMSYLRK